MAKKGIPLVCIFFLFVLFSSCNQTAETSLLPLSPVVPKKVVTFKSPTANTFEWQPAPPAKNPARVVPTKYKLFEETPFYTQRFKNLKAPPDSILLPFNSLPHKSFSFKGTEKKISPRIIKLGQPLKVKAQLPLVEDLSTCGIMHLSADQGLPSTVVNGIAQDNEGRLWMATEHGLCQYDGQFFYTWFKQNGISRDELRFIYKDSRDHLWVGGSGVDEIIPSEGVIRHYGRIQLGNNGIVSVKEDSRGRMIFALIEGIAIFDPKTDVLKILGPETGITKAVVNTLMIDRQERIWLALNGGGVNILDPSDNTIHFIDDKLGLSNNDIRDIMLDKNGNVWMGGWNGGVDYYNPATGAFHQLRVKHGLCHSYIRCFSQDEHSNIWIGCLSAGLDVYDPVQRKLFHAYGRDGVVRSDCRSIFRDKQNRMWIGTNGSGVLLYDPTMGLKDNFDTRWRFAKAPVNITLEDSEGNYWVGTGGLGLDVYNPKDNTIKHLMNEDWTDGWINRMNEDEQGFLWLTTDYRLDRLEKHSGVVTSWGKDEGCPNEMIRAMAATKNLLYLGTAGGVEYFDKQKQTFCHLSCPADPCKSLVSFMQFDRRGHLWVCTNTDGVYEIDTLAHTQKHYGKEHGFKRVFIYSMAIDKKGHVWLGTGGDGIKIIDPVANQITSITTADGLAEMTVLSLHEKEGKMYAGTVKGLSVIEEKENSFAILNYDKAQGLEATDFNQNAVMEAKDGRIWWGVGEALTIFSPSQNKLAVGKTFISGIEVNERKMSPSNNVFFESLGARDTVWAPTRDTFYLKENLPADTLFSKNTSVSWNKTTGVFNLPNELTLPYYFDHLTFHFTSNFLSNTNRVSYRYILEGADKDWSQPTAETQADYRNLPPGRYTFKACSNNFNGSLTDAASFSFTILPPWWRTPLAYVVYIALFIGSIIGYNRLRTVQLLARQKELEQSVRERTAQIEKQKDEIGQQKQLVEEKQKEILDSINYAKRIQYTLLAHDEVLKNNLKELFVLFQPKDIVSGDFYWATTVNGRQNAGNSSNFPAANSELFYLAVCDSTGHGVPGAFMSLLNISFLNEAISDKKIYSPERILDYVRERLINNMSTDSGRDGMDGILLCFDKTNNTISYASGNNTPILFSEAGVHELPYNKMPIGKGEKNEPFTLHQLNVKPGDTLYLYTDGFADQFGGPSGKKLKRRKLNEIISANASLPLQEQKDKLQKVLNEWKGNLEQVDDVTVIGIRF